MEEKNSNCNIHAESDQLDKSLNNELEGLQRIIDLSKESTPAAKQIIDEGVANEPDNPCVEEEDDNNKHVVQPQSQSAEQGGINHTDSAGQSNDIIRRRLRNKSRRGKRNDSTKGGPGCNQQESFTSAKKKNNMNQKKQQNQPRKQADEIATEDDKNSTENVESPCTEKKTQPTRMEGRGRGARRRRARRRHQEQDKQQNSDEPTSSCNEIPNESIAEGERESKENTQMKHKDDHVVKDTKKPKAGGPGEGKGRRARARRARLRREQQRVKDEGATTESNGQIDNLS